MAGYRRRGGARLSPVRAEEDLHTDDEGSNEGTVRAEERNRLQAARKLEGLSVNGTSLGIGATQFYYSRLDLCPALVPMRRHSLSLDRTPRNPHRRRTTRRTTRVRRYHPRTKGAPKGATLGMMKRTKRLSLMMNTVR
jgi:hypothetical protein